MPVRIYSWEPECYACQRLGITALLQGDYVILGHKREKADQQRRSELQALFFCGRLALILPSQ